MNLEQNTLKHVVWIEGNCFLLVFKHQTNERFTQNPKATRTNGVFLINVCFCLAKIKQKKLIKGTKTDCFILK